MDRSHAAPAAAEGVVIKLIRFLMALASDFRKPLGWALFLTVLYLMGWAAEALFTDRGGWRTDPPGAMLRVAGGCAVLVMLGALGLMWQAGQRLVNRWRTLDMPPAPKEPATDQPGAFVVYVARVARDSDGNHEVRICYVIARSAQGARERVQQKLDADAEAHRNEIVDVERFADTEDVLFGYSFPVTPARLAAWRSPVGAPGLDDRWAPPRRSGKWPLPGANRPKESP